MNTFAFEIVARTHFNEDDGQEEERVHGVVSARSLSTAIAKAVRQEERSGRWDSIMACHVVNLEQQAVELVPVGKCEHCWRFTDLFKDSRGKTFCFEHVEWAD